MAVRLKKNNIRNSINFEEKIIYEQDYVPKREFDNIVGNYLYHCVNEDFEWHVFFKMLFDIEEGRNIDTFYK